MVSSCVSSLRRGKAMTLSMKHLEYCECQRRCVLTPRWLPFSLCWSSFVSVVRTSFREYDPSPRTYFVDGMVCCCNVIKLLFYICYDYEWWIWASDVLWLMVACRAISFLCWLVHLCLSVFVLSQTINQEWGKIFFWYLAQKYNTFQRSVVKSGFSFWSQKSFKINILQFWVTRTRKGPLIVNE